MSKKNDVFYNFVMSLSEDERAHFDSEAVPQTTIGLAIKKAWTVAWDYQQADIDRLMLEHCPEEMSREQLTEWAAHQRPNDVIKKYRHGPAHPYKLKNKD